MRTPVRRVLIGCACVLVVLIGALVAGRILANRAMDRALNRPSNRAPHQTPVAAGYSATEPSTPTVAGQPAPVATGPRVVAQADRARAAGRLEQRVRGEGLDVHVTTSGGESTTLQVNYSMINSALIYAVMNNDELTSKLKGVGFEEVRFDNGSKSWTEALK